MKKFQIAKHETDNYFGVFVTLFHIRHIPSQTLFVCTFKGTYVEFMTIPKSIRKAMIKDAYLRYNE